MKDVCLSQLSREDRDKFKSKLLGVLNKLMEVCEANNIHWYVGFGACIGAIRHKGCFPWDDDIDVCMPRPDYDRFVEICKKRTWVTMNWQIFMTPPVIIHVLLDCATKTVRCVFEL